MKIIRHRHGKRYSAVTIAEGSVISTGCSQGIDSSRYFVITADETENRENHTHWEYSLNESEARRIYEALGRHIAKQLGDR